MSLQLIKITRSALEGVNYLQDIIINNSKKEIKTTPDIEKAKIFDNYSQSEKIIEDILFIDDKWNDYYFESIDYDKEMEEHKKLLDLLKNIK